MTSTYRQPLGFAYPTELGGAAHLCPECQVNLLIMLGESMPDPVGTIYTLGGDVLECFLCHGEIVDDAMSDDELTSNLVDFLRHGVAKAVRS